MNHILKRFVTTANNYTRRIRLAGSPASVSLDRILDCADRVQKTSYAQSEKDDALQLIFKAYERVQSKVKRSRADESWNNAKFDNSTKVYAGEPIIYFGENFEHISEKFQTNDGVTSIKNYEED
tara:strand:- start:73 stop:444 length:372 start_codon:yes stop_codon:yes gene_type:complete